MPRPSRVTKKNTKYYDVPGEKQNEFDDQDEFEDPDLYTQYMIYDDFPENQPFQKYTQNQRAKCSEGAGNFSKCETELGCYFDHATMDCVPTFDMEAQDQMTMEMAEREYQREERRKAFLEELEDDASLEDRMARRKAFLQATKKRPDVHFEGNSGDLMARNIEVAKLLKQKLGFNGAQTVKLLALKGHAARGANGHVGVTFSNDQLNRLRQMPNLPWGQQRKLSCPTKNASATT